MLADEGSDDKTQTGEHFFGASLSPTATLDPATARRIADLTSQIDFLNLEALRYRETLEADRIAQSKQLSEATLKTDAELDALRREHRDQIKQVHEWYRKLMASRQIDFETALSKASADHADQLRDRQARHEHALERTSARRQSAHEAAHKRLTDELVEQHREELQTVQRELETSRSLAGRLQYQQKALVDEHNETLAHVQTLQAEAARKRRAFDTLEAHQHANVADLEDQLRTAQARTESERKRSAATLAELLERSASLATEVDAARSEFAAQQAVIEQQALAAQRQAQREYDALAEAVERRDQLAAQREADLEHVIAQLRAELGR